jgi:hypothetical protein
MYVLRVPYLAIVWVGAIVTNLSCPFRLLYVEFQAEGFGLQQIRDGQQILMRIAESSNIGSTRKGLHAL